MDDSKWESGLIFLLLFQKIQDSGRFFYIKTIGYVAKNDKLEASRRQIGGRNYDKLEAGTTTNWRPELRQIGGRNYDKLEAGTTTNWRLERPTMRGAGVQRVFGLN